MGGNAIKTVKVNRFSGSEYCRISHEILKKLEECGIEADIPYHLSTKETFGDIDILIQNKERFDLRQWITDTYNPCEIVCNGVFSIAYFDIETNKYFQVDFISVNHLEAAMFFFSYGDSGAIIGRYSGFHGLTFSESGLSIKVRRELLKSEDPEIFLSNDNFQNIGSSSYVYDKIHLTSDLDIICEILGFDKSEWMNISNSNSLFNWLMSSRYYTRDAFTFVPTDKRKRLFLRPLYMEFIRKIGIENCNDIENKITAPSSLELQMHLLERFDKIHILNEINQKIKLERVRREKFNANIFIELGVKNKHLSIVMKKFKISTLIKFCDYSDFDLWLDSNNKETIDNEIRMYINEL